MKTLRECASIAVTAFEVTRGRFFDDRDRRRHIESAQAQRLARVAAADAADRACARAAERIVSDEYRWIVATGTMRLEDLANTQSGWGG